MTLSRHMGLLIVVLVLAIGGSGLVVSVAQFRAVSEANLQQHTQELTDTMAFFMKGYFSKPEQTKKVVDILFQRGELASLAIHDASNKVLAERSRQSKPDLQYPEILYQWVGVNKVEAQSDIVMRGKVVGSVRVVADIQSVQDEVIRLVIRTVLAFVLIAFVVFVLAMISLKRLLIPLKAIERQAVAISEKKYLTQTNVPKARELAMIVQAMNHMSQEVEQAFSNYSETIDQLYDMAHKDRVTGWLIREPFLKKMQDLLESGEAGSGVFMVVRLGDLAYLNQEIGYDKVDKWLMAAAVGLMDVTESADLAIHGRVRGGELAVMAVGASMDELNLKMRAQLHTMTQEVDAKVQPIAAVIQYAHTPPSSVLLSAIDEMLLEGGGLSSPLQLKVLDSVSAAKGRQVWRDTLKAIFSLERPNVHFVPVRSSGLRGKIYFRCWLECLDDDDMPVTARMVEALSREEGYGERLSMTLLRAAKTKLESSKTFHVCVPLMLKDLHADSAILQELKGITSNPDLAKRLVVEFTEFDALRNTKAVTELLRPLHIHGLGIAMSRVSGYLPSETWIHWDLTYIVLDSSWCLLADGDAQTQVWQKLAKSARERGIFVWSDWSDDYDARRNLDVWVDGWVLAPEQERSGEAESGSQAS